MSDHDKVKASSYRWVILFIVWASVFAAVVAQFQVAALAYKIIPAFNMTTGQYSMVLTAPMLAGVCFSLVAGALADRFGVKRVVAVGFVFSIAGTFFRYAANTYWEMFFLMFLSGIIPGLVNANAAKLLGAWFPKEQMGLVMGIYFTSNGMGITVGLATTALFPSAKSAFITAGILIFVIWILWLLFIKAKPPGGPELPVLPMAKYMGVAAKSKNVWLVGMALMFFMGSSMAFSGFLPNALHDQRGMSPVTAGFMASLITFGTIIGSLIGPVISNKLGRIKYFIIPVAVIGAIAGYLSWAGPQGSMPALLFVLGLLAGMPTPLLLAFPMLLPEIGPVYAGSAGGMIGTLQVMGAVFIPSLIIAPIAGQNYTLFFTLGSLCLFAEGITTLFLPELGAKTRENSSKVGGSSLS
ncbi:MAG: MFS transporter [Peptococcaceae bacterium]